MTPSRWWSTWFVPTFRVVVNSHVIHDDAAWDDVMFQCPSQTGHSLSIVPVGFSPNRALWNMALERVTSGGSLHEKLGNIVAVMSEITGIPADRWTSRVVYDHENLVATYVVRVCGPCQGADC